MHIGLIGGIGPAATVFYYNRIEQAFASAGAPLHLTIGHTSALALSQNVAAGRATEQATEFVRIANQLAAAGADTVAITSMGAHFCAPEFEAQSPLPLIDGPSAVAQHLARLGIRRIGILGTRIVMQTCLYGALGAHDPVAPAGEDLIRADADYVAVAIAGRASPEQRERLLAAGDALVRDQGADAVLLGGTDLNLVFDGTGFDHTVIDSAAAHADAIVTLARTDPAP